MKRHLEALLRQALSDTIAAGQLALTELPAFSIEVPSDPQFGDLASNVALVLAKRAGRPPRALAESILAHLRDPDGLTRLDRDRRSGLHQLPLRVPASGR